MNMRVLFVFFVCVFVMFRLLRFVLNCFFAVCFFGDVLALCKSASNLVVLGGYTSCGRWTEYLTS